MAGTDTSAGKDADHGDGSLYPWRIPLHEWLGIIRRIARESLRDHVFIASSGVAFLALFALLPMLAALVSVYGLVSSPQQLSLQLQSLSSVAPPGMIDALREAMHSIVRDSGVRLGFGILISICVAVWVAVRGVLGIISALNIVYQEREKRSLPVLVGTALALSFGALIFWLTALVMIFGAPWLMHQTSLDSVTLHAIVLAARWLIIAVASLVSMAVLYRFGPSHTNAHWEWLSVGSFVATALWLAGSAGMSWFASNLGQLRSAYGSLSLVMVVMTWFFLTAFVFLLGAELNVQTRHQTATGSNE